MDFESIKKITEKLSSSLDYNRYVHTLGVAFTAASLAMRYEYDTDRAFLAGLLHDCAKCLPDNVKLRLCREYGVALTSSELNNHKLIHAKLGPYIAKFGYHVSDREIFDAIRTHTTGYPDMSLLQKIIFAADYIEPNRDDYIPDISEIRLLAFWDLDLCIYRILKNSLEYLESSGAEIDPTTRKAYDYYKNIIDSRD